MKTKEAFAYTPYESELEGASNAYVISLLAVVAGLPIPIFNLLASIIFYFGTRKSTYFVRWHTTQFLLSQLFLFFFNSFGFWWSLSIFLQKNELSNAYIGYLIFLIVVNISEFILTVYSAIQVRKGVHVQWYFFGTLTQQLVKNKS
ncbi:hypothetical protein [Sphingobacterium hungaricum]|uniref:DUF4870 domain-containing protein n=1 Tax=Sphingobacterium hungaricum TaxID=2082723 RepID=A0A928UX55_9SPHI|nr:hypothetical protein [Sphingobacterium hungaricum]MBE8713598.1 hypothetical protein [Sphingobacterium hungaricum]